MFLLKLLALVVGVSEAQVCFSGGNPQLTADNTTFYAGCTQINGSLTIPVGVNGTEVSALSTVTWITGTLTLRNGGSLTGLTVLKRVGGLTIDNAYITDYSGLGALTRIDGALRITNVRRLQSVDFLAALTYAASLTVMNCPWLTSLGGLGGVQWPKFVPITLNNMVNLTRVDGLEGLTYGGTLLFSNVGSGHQLDLSGLRNMQNVSIFGPAGTNVSDLSQLTGLRYVGTLNFNNVPIVSFDSLPAGVRFQPNQFGQSGLGFTNLPELRSITAFASRLTIVSNVLIQTCPKLTSLAGLDNLTAVSALQLDSTGLADLSALSHLRTASSIVLGGMPLISSLGPAFPALVSESPLSLTILSMVSLTSLEGLDGVNYINSLYIAGCNDLATLDGLGTVTTILSSLQLENNAALASIDALASVTSNVGSISLENLPMLTTFEFPNVANVGSITISGLPTGAALCASLQALAELVENENSNIDLTACLSSSSPSGGSDSGGSSAPESLTSAVSMVQLSLPVAFVLGIGWLALAC